MSKTNSHFFYKNNFTTILLKERQSLSRLQTVITKTTNMPLSQSLTQSITKSQNDKKILNNYITNRLYADNVTNIIGKERNSSNSIRRNLK